MQVCQSPAATGRWGDISRKSLGAAKSHCNAAPTVIPGALKKYTPVANVPVGFSYWYLLNMARHSEGQGFTNRDDPNSYLSLSIKIPP